MIPKDCICTVKMAHYGELIGVVDPVREAVYDAFAEYYKNPQMLKTEQKDGCGIYMAKLEGLMGIHKRYIVAIVNGDRRPTNTSHSLRELEWDSFQTRTLEKNMSIRPIIHVARTGTPLDDVIVRVEQDLKKSVYKAKKSNLVITLLRPKEMTANFQEKGTVASALETFNTIVVFSG